MDNIFEKLQKYQLNIEEFIDKISSKQVLDNENESTIAEENIKAFSKKLGVNLLLLENLNQDEIVFYSIGIHLMKNMGMFIFDSTNVHRKMTASRNSLQGKEYKVINEIEDGAIDNDEVAFLCISIAYQEFIKGSKEIVYKYTESELLVIIKDFEGKKRDILIRFYISEIDSDKSIKLNVLKETIE